MTTSRSDKRTQLVRAASNLVHRRGFNRTTLADIADEAGVRLGNVYYYFKTKAAIGEAIVEQRARDYQALLHEWDKLQAPESRLEAFIQFTCESRALLARSGCPIGTLCMDLRKEDDNFARNAAKNAATLFGEILAWLERQFREMGHGDQSRQLAQHLASTLQGASLIALVFGRREFVSEESELLRKWLGELIPSERSRARAK
jgi:AcrR family transcriptional regulator